ncbi:hypothetical protein [Agrococcus jejuensis]|uniref:Uncharacterized protein n=1 Tax=Agrococcus jejuensis TaxID=399736 RepID=A0A1G7ZMZ7_9MICO|nr:hypothetical protein [Agrococcus jejuensis]SDH09936.1 hypothetical protein SAMN04489720_0030 [Agrococcus jejuensis]
MTTATAGERERTRRRRPLVIALVVLLLLWLGTVATWAVVDAGRDGVIVVGGGTDQESVTAPSGALSISGSLTVPLQPGMGERLDLVILNETDAALAVSGLSVRIADVVAPNATAELGCSVADFAIEQSTFGFELAGASSSSLTGAGAVAADLPLLSMLDTDVDQAGCVGATLALEYAAVGTPA